MKNMNYKYTDGCSLELQSDKRVIINSDHESYQFDETDKPIFTYDTGETVVEYSGLAADNNPTCSWAKANYAPNGYSVLHYHCALTEDYYIVAGEAEVSINGNKQKLTAGSHIQIQPGQRHQVQNLSATENLTLIVKCTPSWHKEDFNLVEEQTEQTSSEQEISSGIRLTKSLLMN